MRTLALALLAACASKLPPPKEPEFPPPKKSPVANAKADPYEQGKPPLAKPRPAHDTYHGVTVEDPYRWLEADSDEVKQWSDGQNRYARGVLDKLPEVDKLRTELTAIVKAPITEYGGFKAAGGKLFAFRKDPAKEQAELIVLDDPERPDTLKVVLDPTANAGAAKGNPHRTIDWFVPAPDGKRVAVSISENGSEKGSLHVVDLDGKELEPVIPNVQRATGGGSVAWAATGFHYTRYPAAGEKPDEERDFWMQVWFHETGKPIASDVYELGKDLPKIAEIVLESDARGRVLAKVQNGDSSVFRHYLRDGGKWRQLSDWDDQVVYVGFGPTEDLWLVSRKGAPRGKVLRLAPTAPLAQAKVVVPEAKDSIVTSFYTDDWGVIDAGPTFYLAYQTGGPSEVRAFLRTGQPAKAPVLPPVSAVGKPVPWRDGVLVSASSYTTPRTLYRFSAKTGALAILAGLSPKPPVDLSSFEVHRELATSKDGTKIPVNIVWPKGAPRDGSVPCIANGYGGYAISEQPHFLATWAPLLQRGMCFVHVNLRGGAEYGEDWHRAGMLTRKQNVFDDFAAALNYVIDNKYTRAGRLGIIGGSNGGLLVGAILTQHPELVNAVVAQVGIFDSIRAERSANGQYNIPEYGSVADEAQFKALLAYSPYHHVTNTAYPAILFLTGANDARVEPWHSRKMAARLQNEQASIAPVLLRTSANAGHGSGTDTTEAIEQLVHIEAFFRWQLPTALGYGRFVCSKSGRHDCALADTACTRGSCAEQDEAFCFQVKSHGGKQHVWHSICAATENDCLAWKLDRSDASGTCTRALVGDYIPDR